MAAAQIALGIEMDNRMKRKAAAMGVFLNVETQKKLLKLSSNQELREENRKLEERLASKVVYCSGLFKTVASQGCQLAKLERHNWLLKGTCYQLEKDLYKVKMEEEGYDVGDVY